MQFLYVTASILGNAGVAWLFSWIVGWNYMETIFLSGLLVFGVVWMILLNHNQSTNILNATIKGTTGVSAGVSKPFTVTLNSFMIGTIVYLVTSGVATFIYYLPYFTA